MILDSSDYISLNSADYGGVIAFGSNTNNFRLVGGNLNTNFADIAGGAIYMRAGSSATISNTTMEASGDPGGKTALQQRFARD